MKNLTEGDWRSMLGHDYRYTSEEDRKSWWNSKLKNDINKNLSLVFVNKNPQTYDEGTTIDLRSDVHTLIAKSGDKLQYNTVDNVDPIVAYGDDIDKNITDFDLSKPVEFIVDTVYFDVYNTGYTILDKNGYIWYINTYNFYTFTKI